MMNQFRRDPVSGQWSIIVKNDYDILELIGSASSDSRNIRNEDDCILCSGRENQTNSEIFAVRDNNSSKNEPGWKVRVIPNEQPILQIYGDLNNRGVGMYDVLDGIGAHELIVESPDHRKHMPDMELEQIQNVLASYSERILDLKRDPRFRYVLIQKNHGEGDGDIAGHSHSHVIATPITPGRVKEELVNAMEHYRYKERCLFCDMISQEILDNQRVIVKNDKFIAFAPFASRAPFAVRIMPLDHQPFFEGSNEFGLLAYILREILVQIHKTLNNPNFIMTLHSGPNLAAGQDRGYWKTLEKDYHWHIDITPRFRGYSSFDVGSGFQVNIIPPERAATILKSGEIDHKGNEE